MSGHPRPTKVKGDPKVRMGDWGSIPHTEGQKSTIGRKKEWPNRSGEGGASEEFDGQQGGDQRRGGERSVYDRVIWGKGPPVFGKGPAPRSIVHKAKGWLNSEKKDWGDAILRRQGNPTPREKGEARSDSKPW